MTPIYILGTGIHSCLATSISDLSAALTIGKCATPDAVPSISNTDLSRAGIHRNLATRMSQAERYAFMAASQVMSSVFHLTDPDSRTLTSPLWDTHSVRLGVIVANDASVLPLSEVLSTRVPASFSSEFSLPSRLALQCMTSSVSSFLAPLVGARAFAFTVGAACASSHLALRTAALYLEEDLADMILVVGVSETGATAHLAFNALGIDGVHPSGGAAAVLLASNTGILRHYYKSDTHSAPRFDFPRITGFGLSQSPNRVTPDVPAMTNAIDAAIRSACLSLHDIDFILAHHTGSTVGNSSEDAAIGEIFTGINHLPGILSTKILHGHEMWMSGLSQLVEAVTIFSLFDGGIVPTIHLNELDDDHVPIDLPPKAILCNSFAFGGTCSAFVVEA